MVRLTLISLIFFYTLFSAFVILIIWLISGYRGMKRYLPRDVDYIWKCPVCAHTYVDSKHEGMSACPLCGSYNKK